MNFQLTFFRLKKRFSPNIFMTNTIFVKMIFYQYKFNLLHFRLSEFQLMILTLSEARARGGEGLWNFFLFFQSVSSGMHHGPGPLVFTPTQLGSEFFSAILTLESKLPSVILRLKAKFFGHPKRHPPCAHLCLQPQAKASKFLCKATKGVQNQGKKATLNSLNT